MGLSQAKIVDPARIQEELHLIWESFQATNTTRACLFNLIFYTQKDYRYTYIEKLAAALVQKFPARIIFVLFDPNKVEETLKTTVAILSNNLENFDVACDVISIEASGKAKEKIPFLILPHIVPDLPIYIIFGEDPGHRELSLQRIEKLADRLIFDSETTTDLSLFAKLLLEKYTQQKIDIADLNWARTETWRGVLLTTFGTCDKLASLEKAQTITITYNAQKTSFFTHTKIQALYLHAWLATQMHWEYKSIETSADTLHIKYQTPYTQLLFSLVPQSLSTLPPGLILSFEMETLEPCHYALRTNLDAIEEIILHISTPGSCLMPSRFLFSKVAQGHSLVNEIYHKGTSPHLLAVLHQLQTLDIPNLC